MFKINTLTLAETGEDSGTIDFECTLEIPKDDGGGFVHLKGKIEVTKLPPE